MTPACPDENTLVLLADGALAESRRASIERHLDGCGACTLLVAELANMAAPVRPVPTRYKVIRQLGAGAMGVVWEAEDTSLGRRVALKFVRTTDGETALEARRERRSRLVREARALAQLRHPNVVSVYDVGESADELFLALELVIGTDARSWRSAPRSSADILGVWRQVAAGLAAVHRAGIVHRDIKPDNVLVANDGRVLLGDFGLATDRFAQHPPATHLTEAGAIVGTPIYMAHEQLLGEPATQKSDQFALCVSIWEALAGTRPFVGPTLGAIAAAMQARLEPPLTMRPHVFAALARGLHPDPARRWPTIDALLTALDGATPTRTTRPLWLALGAAVVAATGTLAVLAWRDSSPAHASAVPVATPPAPAWTVTAPIEVATPTEREPPPPPVKRARAAADWKLALDRATSKLAFGEAGACLDLLATISAAPPTADEQIETLRATCMMKHGDCAGGRALFEAVARANHWDKAHLAVRMRDADFAYCPLDAGPRDRWAPRARYRLVIATGMKISCKPVLAFMAKHDVTLADPHEQLILESRCHVNAGACAAGRMTWRTAATRLDRDPAMIAARERLADESFAATFPSCRSAIDH